MAKVAIKSEKISPFGGIFSIMEQFDSKLSSIIDSTLGMRCRLYGYQYSEIIRSLMSVYFCGGSCIEDNTLLLNCLLSTGQLKEGEGYDVDFDHQFIEAEIAYAADIVAFAFVGTLAASFAVILCTFALVAALQMYFSQNDYDQDYNPPNLFPYL